MTEEENNNNNNFSEPGSEPENTQLSSAKPSVASAPGKMMFVVVFALIFVGIVVKSLFFGEPPPPEKPTLVKETVATKSAASQNQEIIDKNIELPKPPTNMSSISVPPPPPPPVAIPNIAPPANPEVQIQKTAKNEELKKRINSPMITGGGGSSFSSNTSTKSEKKRSSVANSSDPNSAFAQNASDLSEAVTATATRIDDLNTTVAQGKMIEGVLETAIDSTLPGSIRAIVSHDVYAEAGRDILIPKGSRIIGTYNPSIRRGQARVFIIWSRLIRPDGIDIAIDSPGADALGRAGMPGDVDNKYFESFSTAILVSSLDIGLAAAGEGIFGDQQQTSTTGASGGTTTTSSPTTTAMQESVETIGSVGQSIVGSVLNVAPTIFIDQGQRIRIFVNKDLIFPTSLTGSTRFVE